MAIPHLFVAANMCFNFLAGRCLAMDVRTNSAIQAFRRHNIYQQLVQQLHTCKACLQKENYIWDYHFWTLSIVRYSEEYSVSETDQSGGSGRNLLCCVRYEELTLITDPLRSAWILYSRCSHPFAWGWKEIHFLKCYINTNRMLKKIPCLGTITKTSRTNFCHEKQLNSRLLGVWISRYYYCFSCKLRGGSICSSLCGALKLPAPIWMALQTAEGHGANGNPQETYSMSAGIEPQLQGTRSVWTYKECAQCTGITAEQC
jgi:hypothetical protein